jgi:uncharacterized membrane protein HdeD (DUF308 family)
MGVAALVLGILGLILLIIPVYVTQILGLCLGVVALILGIIGRKQASEEGKPTGMSTAGMVLGIIATALNALAFIACQLCINEVGNNMSQAIEQAQKANQDPKAKEATRKMLQKMQEALREAQKKGE